MIHVTIPISLTDIPTNCLSPEGVALCRAVVDIEKHEMIIGAGMHVDEEEKFLDLESEQAHLWGINLYPQFFGTDTFIEYDSMINLRPGQGNKTRSVDDPEIRQQIEGIVLALIRS